MAKSWEKEHCNGWLVVILFIAIIIGLLFFLGNLDISRFDYERLVLYSILMIFGITMSTETVLYRRLKEEEAKLREDLEKLKKEVKQIKK
jgi:uncharacterized membrane protein YbhN (UPF0104 family)